MPVISLNVVLQFIDFEEDLEHDVIIRYNMRQMGIASDSWLYAD